MYLKGSVISLLVLMSASGHAEAAGDDDGRRWYGYQTIAVDVGSMASMGAGVAFAFAAGRDPSPAQAAPGVIFASAGLLGYAFGGPIVHWVHGRTATGFLSLGLRAAVPLMGLGIGALVPELVRVHDNLPGSIVGTCAGAGAAMALDAAFLGFERKPKPSGWRLMPTVFPSTMRTRMLGVTGTF